MKSIIYDHEQKKIFEGEYEYVEAGRTDGKPSFHFSINNRDNGYKNYEIHFLCENEEEFDKMIEDMREQVHKK